MSASRPIDSVTFSISFLLQAIQLLIRAHSPPKTFDQLQSELCSYLKRDTLQFNTILQQAGLTLLTLYHASFLSRELLLSQYPQVGWPLNQLQNLPMEMYLGGLITLNQVDQQVFTTAQIVARQRQESQELQQKIEQLKKDMTILQSQRDELKTQRDELMQQTKELEVKSKRLKFQLSDQGGKLKNNKSTLKAIKHELDLSERELEKYKARKVKKQKRNEALIETNKVLETEIKALKAKKDRLIAAITKLENPNTEKTKKRRKETVTETVSGPYEYEKITEEEFLGVVLPPSSSSPPSPGSNRAGLFGPNSIQPGSNQLGSKDRLDTTSLFSDNLLDLMIEEEEKALKDEELSGSFFLNGS